MHEPVLRTLSENNVVLGCKIPSMKEYTSLKCRFIYSVGRLSMSMDDDFQEVHM